MGMLILLAPSDGIVAAVAVALPAVQQVVFVADNYMEAIAFG
jgi:hypothetical protein